MSCLLPQTVLLSPVLQQNAAHPGLTKTSWYMCRCSSRAVDIPSPISRTVFGERLIIFMPPSKFNQEILQMPTELSAFSMSSSAQRTKIPLLFFFAEPTGSSFWETSNLSDEADTDDNSKQQDLLFEILEITWRRQINFSKNKGSLNVTHQAKSLSERSQRNK